MGKQLVYLRPDVLTGHHRRVVRVLGQDLLGHCHRVLDLEGASHRGECMQGLVHMPLTMSFMTLLQRCYQRVGMKNLGCEEVRCSTMLCWIDEVIYWLRCAGIVGVDRASVGCDTRVMILFPSLSRRLSNSARGTER